MGRLATTTFLLLLIGSLAPAGPAWGQVGIAATDRDPDAVFKFNFPAPGARSLAMGGAFLGLADDATAAFTNPAGLTSLTIGGDEAAIELRHIDLTNIFVNRGHYSDVPGFGPEVTGRGVDSLAGLELAEASSDSLDVSFLSYAHVLPRGIVLAVYRHELANTSTAIEAEGAFLDSGFFDESGNLLGLFGVGRNLPKRITSSLEIVNYGVSAAIEFEFPSESGFESALSVGLGISYYDFDIDAQTQFFYLDRGIGSADNTCRDSPPDPTCGQPGRLFGEADHGPGNVKFEDQETGTDDALGFNMGLLWKLGRSERWSLGAVFREGPEFETDLAFRDCFLFDANGDLVRDPEFTVPDRLTLFCDFLTPGGGLPANGSVTVPDVYGLGVAYRSPGDRTKIALDLNHVRYSQRRIDYLGPNMPMDFSADDFRVEDADQIHLGVEQIVFVVESLFVGTARFGAWHEPYHELEYVGDDGLVAGPLALTRHVLDRPTDDEMHFSFGFGLAIKEDYQIDLAVDLSEPATTFSFSLVRFL